MSGSQRYERIVDRSCLNQNKVKAAQRRKTRTWVRVFLQYALGLRPSRTGRIGSQYEDGD
jgi:hypothetical protein